MQRTKHTAEIKAEAVKQVVDVAARLGLSEGLLYAWVRKSKAADGTFRWLMRDTGLLKNEHGQNRTLYSLRHNNPTFELLRGGTDIHTISKQLGNSAPMTERHSQS